MCTFEQIQQANATIQTTNIKGKDYAEVNQRIKAFRMVHPSGCIRTEKEFPNAGVVVFTAYVSDEKGNLLGTGTAQEKENSSFINKTSYIENCETSAVGRALGMAGFGIDTSVASAEEVTNAINNQNKQKDDMELKMQKALWDYSKENQLFSEKYLKPLLNKRKIRDLKGNELKEAYNFMINNPNQFKQHTKETN